MTITQVTYALEAASCRSISRAADRLYISQSALSQQIAKLEQELGYPLFTRSLYGLELTAAGERFCEEGRPLLESWNAFHRAVQAGSPTARQQLRIGMGSRVYSNGLFPEILSFFDERPELEVSFVTEAGSDFLSALHQQSIDLALDVLPSEDYLASRREFFSCPLIREPQCVLMAENDPLAGRESLSLSELQGATMMSGLERSTEARHLHALCRDSGITLNRIYRSDGIGTVMNLVRAGRGVVLGPKSFADYYQVAAVPLMPKSEASLHFICLQRAIHTRVIREFHSFLLALCRRDARQSPAYGRRA